MQYFLNNRKFFPLFFFLILHNLILGNEIDTIFKVLKLKVTQTDTFLYKMTETVK